MEFNFCVNAYNGNISSLILKQTNMKKTVLIGIAILGMLAFTTAEKKYHFEITVNQANRMFNDFGGIKQVVENSQLPHIQAKAIINSIDSISADILPQLKAQAEAEPKK